MVPVRESPMIISPGDNAAYRDEISAAVDSLERTVVENRTTLSPDLIRDWLNFSGEWRVWVAEHSSWWPGPDSLLSGARWGELQGFARRYNAYEQTVSRALDRPVGPPTASDTPPATPWWFWGLVGVAGTAALGYLVWGVGNLIGPINTRRISRRRGKPKRLSSDELRETLTE